MTDPHNAIEKSLAGQGFRFYRWDDKETGETTDVLSVSSIRTLTGENFNLVNWQIANVIDVAMSTMKMTRIGPRGGVSEVRVKDEYPGEFHRRYMDSGGEQGKLDELRAWTREQADQPRNIAAKRGSIVHKAIEQNVTADRIERPYVEAQYALLSQRDRIRSKRAVSDQDVEFIRNAMRQYEFMRQERPFVVLAREAQVWNLTAGYAGSLDSLIWFLPEGTGENELRERQRQADRGEIWLSDIHEGGGYLAVGDWKTATDIHTDNVIQIMAYGGAEFVGSDGVKDERLTELLVKTIKGVVVHIRPNFAAVYTFPFHVDIMRAFLGSVAYARFIAMYPKATQLFEDTWRGEAPK